MKYLIEHTNEAELLNQFSPPPLGKKFIHWCQITVLRKEFNLRFHILDTIKKDDSKFVTFQDYMQILVNILINLPLT